MVRTKFSHRKTGGPDSVEGQPASKSVKITTEVKSAASAPEMDSASIILDTEKVQQATAALPKIPKIKIKTEATEKSEDATFDVDNLVSLKILLGKHAFKIYKMS